MNKLKIQLALIFLLSFSSNSFAEIFMIVNNDSPISEMKIEDVKNIYNERTTVWKHNGNTIKSLTLGTGDPAQGEFCQKIYGKEATDVAIEWASRAAQNRLVNPPTQKRSEKSIVRTVKKNPDAIGFITDPSLVKKKVKIVLSF